MGTATGQNNNLHFAVVAMRLAPNASAEGSGASVAAAASEPKTAAESAATAADAALIAPGQAQATAHHLCQHFVGSLRAGAEAAHSQRAKLNRLNTKCYTHGKHTKSHSHSHTNTFCIAAIK